MNILNQNGNSEVLTCLSCDQINRYLEGLSEAAYILLAAEDEIPYDDYLSAVGRAAETCRVYVFLNHTDKEGNILMSQVGEWCREGVEKQIDNHQLQNLPYDTAAPRWYKIFNEGGIINGKVADFPREERSYLEPQGIKALLALPLKYKDQLIGFIGFDNCKDHRQWNETEIHYLKNAAACLTQAICRLRVEKEVKKSEEKLSVLLDCIPAGVQEYDTEGRVVYWNKANEKLYGYTSDQAVGRRLDELIIPQQLRPLFKQALEKAENLDSSGFLIPSGELELVNKNGEKVYVYTVHAAVCQENGTPKLFSMDIDISERKELERQMQLFNDELDKRVKERTWRLEVANAELERQEKIYQQTEEKLLCERERFHQIFEKMDSPSGIFRVVDGGNDIIVVGLNKASRELEKKEKKDFEGKSLLKAFPGVADIGLDDAIKRVWKTGKHEILDCRFYKDKNVSGWRENYIFKLATGEIVTIYRDLTAKVEGDRQIKNYQKALKKLANELALSEEHERKRISAVIHDKITQSLIMTKLKVERLGKQSINDENFKNEIVSELAEAIEQTRDLTFDLSSPVLDELGLSAAISDWMRENVQKKHGINCVYESTTDNVQINHDSAISVFRIVRELLYNAVKHSGAKNIKVFYGQNGENLDIIVSDDGKGFNFNRSVVRYNDKGSGLFSVKERLEYLGGNLEVTSEHEKGSKLKISLPLKNL